MDSKGKKEEEKRRKGMQECDVDSERKGKEKGEREGEEWNLKRNQKIEGKTWRRRKDDHRGDREEDEERMRD